MKKYFFILISFCLFISSCNDNKNKISQNSNIKISLREAWFPWAGYAGELIAEDIGKKQHVDFKVENGAEDIDPIKMVISGKNDFGLASAENLILSNQKGANLVAVGVLNYKSATCYITLPKSNIKTLKDFEGKKVGILTGSETETIYRLLTAKNKINKKNITEVEAPYDLKSFLTTNEYDVRPAFIYDEPVTLDAQNIKYNILKPEDYGIQMMGAVYFTTREMINKHPEKVQAFVNVICAGWEKALSNPEDAIKILKQYDKNIDEKRELACLKKGLQYFAGESGKVLYVNEGEWLKNYNYIKSLGKIEKDFDVRTCINNSFVDKYHANKK